MGAWGAGLYQNDVACDVKEEYLNRLRIGQSNIEALQDTIDYNMDFIEDEDDGPIFWFALADTQWNYGRLHPQIKEEALKHIKSGKDLELWKENEKLYQKRKKVLEKLEEKLNSPQPIEKKVSKLTLTKAKWKTGDILLYKIRNELNEKEVDKWENKYVLLKVVGMWKSNIGSLPRKYSHEHNTAKIYNWVGDSVPDLSIINKLNFIMNRNIFGKMGDAQFTLSFDKSELKKLNFITLMNDRENQEEPENITDGLGVWYNIYNIDYGFVKLLNSAEENQTLIDETKN